MRKIITSLLVLSIVNITLAQKADKRFKGFDEELEKVRQTWKAAGFSIAIVEKDKIVYANGIGYKDYENKVPATANTLFAIGSSTKSFTSAILGVLRSEDKIDFNKSPREYLPELKFFNDDMNNNIIIKDMMSHRTGLPRHDFSWFFFPSDDTGELISRIEHHEPFTGIRQQWFYNNFMFMAQGAIAEKLTGKSWKDNVRDLFFKPLNMTRSNLSIAELEEDTDISLGYQTTTDGEIKKMDYYKIRGMAPAGSINSSANEMASWLITWINGGKFNGKEIIPAAYINEATSSHMVVSGGRPNKINPDLHMSNYGYGWFNSSYRGHYMVQHGGNINGFSAMAAYYPSDSIGVVVLANQNGSAVPSLVRNMAADRMLGLSQKDWSGEAKARQDKQKKATEEAVNSSNDSGQVKGTKPSHILRDYTGAYAHPGYGSFNLILRDDSLFAKFEVQDFYVKHYHYDIFEAYGIQNGEIDTSSPSQLRFSFNVNNTGDISGLNAQFEPTLDPLVFKRTPTTVKVDKDLLSKYEGEYQLAGQTVKIFIKNEDTLYAFVSGQPEYELLATEKHKFSFKVLDGFKVEFHESDSGNIDSVSFIQPNGTFKATRK